MRILFTALLLSALIIPVYAEQTAEAVTPDKALEMLKAGNARFVGGKAEHPRADVERRKETTEKGQHPFATVVGCSDSRVPVEILFDQGVGDVFVIKVAGNVCDVDEIGTIEYGVGHLHTPLLVVMGHTKCGAVTAVVKGDKVGGSIPKLVDNIIPAAEKAKKEHPDSKAEDLIVPTIKNNAFQGIEDVLHHSAEVRELVESGKLKIVAAFYNIESGEIEWLGEHPKQKELMEKYAKEGPKTETKEATHGEKAEKPAEVKKEAEPTNKTVTMDYLVLGAIILFAAILVVFGFWGIRIILKNRK